MASGGYRVLRSLKEEVHCPLCLEVFKEPKRLPCEHVVCIHCLQKLIAGSVGDTLVCPVCRNRIPLKSKNPMQFPTSLVVVRLIDMYLNSQKNQGKDEAVSAKAATSYCEEHSSQPLDLYCENCKKMVCRDCVILYCTKKNHKYGYKSDLSKEYLEDLKNEILPVLKVLESVKEAKSSIVEEEKNILDQKVSHVSRINQHFDELMDILKRDKASLLATVDDHFSESLSEITKKKEELSSAVEELEKFVLSSLNVLEKKDLATVAEEVAKKKLETSFQCTKFKSLLECLPTSSPQVDIELIQPKDLEKLCEGNYIFRSDDIYKSHLAKHIRIRSLELKINESYLLSFHVHGIRWLSKITSKLVHVCEEFSVQLAVKEIAQETYQVCVMTRHPGNYHLLIQCNNVRLCGSPIPVSIHFDPKQVHLGKPLQKISSVACAVKCHDEKLYVMELGKGVTTIEYSYTKMSVARTANTNTRCEFAIHNQDLYLTDYIHHTIVKADMKGKELKSVGGLGDIQGKFNFANGIRVSKSNELYVCDTGNGRIQVFDLELNFLRSIAHFLLPNDLDFDQEGNIYIVEERGYRITVLTRDEKFLRVIGLATDSFSGLSRPVSPAIYDGHIYVTDMGNKNIAVFTLLGEFVATFGEGIFSSPECIAIDSRGNIFVSDDRSKLVRF